MTPFISRYIFQEMASVILSGHIESDLITLSNALDFYFYTLFDFFLLSFCSNESSLKSEFTKKQAGKRDITP